MIGNLIASIGATLRAFGGRLVALLLALFVLTLVGQIPAGEATLEGHYHEFVNSPGFQKTFHVIAYPFAWTGNKLTELVKGSKAWQKSSEWVDTVDQKIDSQLSRQIERTSASAKDAVASPSLDIEE